MNPQRCVLGSGKQALLLPIDSLMLLCLLRLSCALGGTLSLTSCGYSPLPRHSWSCGRWRLAGWVGGMRGARQNPGETEI